MAELRSRKCFTGNPTRRIRIPLGNLRLQRVELLV